MLQFHKRLFNAPRYSTKSRPISSLAAALANGAPIDVHPEVQDALENDRPVVALETTIVTHGMPQPTNLETARSVESIVRAQGVIPATMGIIRGRIKIGLEPTELEYLADVKSNSGVVKVSRRDLGPVLALERDGGTTCSTTLMFAAMAGIKVFATGGLGGVHRAGQNTMDVSADLPELSRCPVGLVSAGVKSILDIGRTLEYLETLGVPVVSYGQTDDFPAFYSRRSGFKSPWRIDKPDSAAQILYAQKQLGMSTGALFAVPIPEEYDAVGIELQSAVEQALAEADAHGISQRGKEVTPWLLKRVGELTVGKSLASNVALIQNTARVGGQIAVAYSNLVKDAKDDARSISSFVPSISHNILPTSHAAAEVRTMDLPQELSQDESLVEDTKAHLVVVGSAAVDITSHSTTEDMAHSKDSTVPGSISLTLGGVGRNIAQAAHQILAATSKDLSKSALLIAPVGGDTFGRLLVEETRQLGMRTDGLLQVASGSSAVCNMILDKQGDLVSGVADMDIIQSLQPERIIESIQTAQPGIVAVDGNLSEHALTAILEYCRGESIQVLFEPTSVAKSQRIIPAIASVFSKPTAHPHLQAPVAYVTPNLLELNHLYQTVSGEPFELTSQSLWWSIIDNFSLGADFRMALERLARLPAAESHHPSGSSLSFLVEKGIAQMAVKLLPFFQHIFLKCGQQGVLAIFRVSHTSDWSQQSTNVKQRYVVARGKDGSAVVIKHYPAHDLAPGDLVNVTGAGDTLVGSILASLVQEPSIFDKSPGQLDVLVQRAQSAAVMTLKSCYAVSPHLGSLCP